MTSRIMERIYRAAVAVPSLIALALLALAPTQASAQSDGAVEIAFPPDGATLSGVVEVRGTADGRNFLSATLAFRYGGDQSEQWFVIADIPQPVHNSQLLLWDTATMTDGAYVLRLRMNGNDGTVQDDIVGVEVRNYTAAPTPTASPTSTAAPVVKVPTPAILMLTPTGFPALRATPTPLPPNPARLTEIDLLGALGRGGIAVAAASLLWGAAILRRRL